MVVVVVVVPTMAPDRNVLPAQITELTRFSLLSLKEDNRAMHSTVPCFVPCFRRCAFPFLAFLVHSPSLFVVFLCFLLLLLLLLLFVFFSILLIHAVVRGMIIEADYVDM